MSASNWCREMSPERNNRYRIDDVGLQLGLGIPIQMVGVSLVSDMQGHGTSWNAPFHSKSRMSKKSSANEIQQTVDGIPIRKVYITNISIDVQKQEMYYIFGRFGEIVHIFIAVSKNDQHKQFAFVTFKYPKDASRVLYRRKFQDFKGRTIYAIAADSWHQPKECSDGRVIWRTTGRPQDKLDEESEDEADQSVDSAVVPVEPTINKEEGLNAVNDDCLLHIFSFLSYKELARIEQVCKRWQGLSYRMWKCLHQLNYSKPTFKGMQAKTPTLEQYLKRCGELLVELDLRVSNHVFNMSTLAIVAKYCGNLEVLRVSNIQVGDRSLAHLGRRCPKLKQLVMDGCTKFNDQDLMSLLPKCPELNELDITQSTGITGRCLLSVQSSIKSLRLLNCTSIETANLIQGLEKMKNLENLALSACGNMQSTDVKLIVDAVPNLTSLTLGRCLPHFDPATLSHVGKLAKLTNLNLSFNSAVADSNLTAIVEGCESLTVVNLSCSGGSSGYLTDRGLSVLSRLRKLTDLDLSYLEATTDVALKNISTRNPRLKRLICRGCPEITDEGSNQIITMSNELELFDVSGCQQITNETITAALTSVKMRTNNIPLKLVAGGTEIEVVEPNNEVPLLTVDLSDLCEEHLRPDFMNDMFFPPSDSEDEEDLDHLCERIGCDCDFDFDDLFDPTFPVSIFDDVCDFYSSDDGDTEYEDDMLADIFWMM